MCCACEAGAGAEEDMDWRMQQLPPPAVAQQHWAGLGPSTPPPAAAATQQQHQQQQQQPKRQRHAQENITMDEACALGGPEYAALMAELEQSLFEGMLADEAAHLAQWEALQQEEDVAALMGHMVRGCPAHSTAYPPFYAPADGSSLAMYR
jgi:hypothetical protein